MPSERAPDLSLFLDILRTVVEGWEETGSMSDVSSVKKNIFPGAHDAVWGAFPWLAMDWPVLAGRDGSVPVWVLKERSFKGVRRRLL